MLHRPAYQGDRLLDGPAMERHRGFFEIAPDPIDAENKPGLRLTNPLEEVKAKVQVLITEGIRRPIILVCTGPELSAKQIAYGTRYQDEGEVPTITVVESWAKEFEGREGAH